MTKHNGGNAIRSFTASPPEVRAVDGETLIEGYAALYNKESVDFGGWTEIIKRGAFDNSLAEKPDVLARLEHENGLNVLARTTAGNLKVWSDDKGLRYSIRPPDTQVARDTIKQIEVGNITQSSFAFWPRPDGAAWIEKGDDVLQRELTDVDLYDVAPVAVPAYSQTSVWTAERSRAMNEYHQARSAMYRKRIMQGRQDHRLCIARRDSR